MSKESKNSKHIHITIVGDEEMIALNSKHLNSSYPTDVLSFPIGDVLEDGSLYVGDIIVNEDQAKRQSAEYGNDTQHEISELVAHGVLHLFGVHHPHDDDDSTHGVKRS